MSGVEPPSPPAGVTIAELRCDLVEVIARRGHATEVGALLPQALPLAPGRWLATEPAGEAGALFAHLSATVGPRAALVDMGSAYRVVRIAGPLVLETLARGCRLDLHARAFPPGKAARSLMAQVPIILHRSDAGRGTEPVAFDLYVPATLAFSFIHHLHRWAHAASDVRRAASLKPQKLTP